MGNFAALFYVNGSLIDTITGLSSISYSTATVLIGEGQGYLTGQPAAKVRFDDMSLVSVSTEYLGNRGFESALAGSYLTPNVYGNWCNANHWRGSGRFTDIVRTGSYSGGMNKEVGYGTWLHQDATLPSIDNCVLQGWVYRSSDTTGSAFQLQLMLDWDRGGGYASGYVSMSQSNSGDVVTSAMGVTHTGFSATPYDEWVHWRINLFPKGKVPGGWSVGRLAW